MKKLYINGEPIVVVTEEEISELHRNGEVFIHFDGPNGPDVARVHRLDAGYGVMCYKHKWDMSLTLDGLIK